MHLFLAYWSPILILRQKCESQPGSGEVPKRLLRVVSSGRNVPVMIVFIRKTYTTNVDPDRQRICLNISLSLKDQYQIMSRYILNIWGEQFLEYCQCKYLDYNPHRK